MGLSGSVRLADLPEVQESVHVAAPPERIWPLVSDIGFLVGVSPELRSVRWVTGDGDAPALGRQFVGANANRYFGEWETTATIVELDVPRTFGWAVGDVDRPNTTWRFTLEPDPRGTLVTQWLRVGPGDSGLVVAVRRMPDKEERIVAGRLAEFSSAMQANLGAIKTRVETA